MVVSRHMKQEKGEEGHRHEKEVLSCGGREEAI